jgi:hypothetical protein
VETFRRHNTGEGEDESAEPGGNEGGAWRSSRMYGRHRKTNSADGGTGAGGGARKDLDWGALKRK